MRRTIGRTLLSLLLSLMLLLSSLPAMAEAGHTISSEITYYSVTLKKPVSWTFDYSDLWFEADSDVYSHQIARASLGLALSGFRNPYGSPDENVLNYLTDLGFADLVSEDYHKTTSIDTIATMIGHKTLPGGEDLIAVTICGQGYKNEWLSNFDIGDQQEHRGFSSAAQKVVQRVEAYMAEHGLTNARIWISGYSRSAAVANLASASLIEKGLFTEKNAFAYTFATPRTTKEPVAHTNIFNIVGKFDPVAKVPYAEWGFERHGITFYTPAQETDSDYRQRQAAADVPFYELTGLHLWNNPGLNQHLAIIQAYLLSNIPSTADYDAYMSTHIANAWSKPDTEALLSVLEAMASIPSPDGKNQTENQKRQVHELIDYVASAVLSVLGYDDTYSDLVLSESVAFSVPIVMEHIPDVYLSWMFSSDDPAKIFSDKTQYMQLVVNGDADVSIFDQQGGFVLSVDPEGTVSETTENERYLKRLRPVEDRPMISAMLARDDRRIIVLPKDQGMPFTMTACSDSDLEYYGIYYDIRRNAPTMSSFRLLHMEAGEEYLGFSLTPDGQARLNFDEPLVGDTHEINRKFDADQLLSISDANLLGGLTPLHLSIRNTIRTILIAAVVCLILLLLVIFLLVRLLRRIIRKIRKKPVKTRKNRQKNINPENPSSK